MPIDPSKPFDLTFKVDPNWVEMRLDNFVKAMVPTMSRTKIQKYVKDKRIEVNGEPRPNRWKVREGDIVLLRCQEPEEGVDAGKYIPLDILYEDDDVLVVNKQAGLVVHPVALHRHDTLLNALYWRYKDILPDDQEISLANRIDKNTSGVILVTKHTEAKRIVQTAFENREPKKAYRALLEGILEPDEGSVDLPLGPSLEDDRCKMGVRHDEEGKPSLTHFEVLERFAPEGDDAGFTFVRLEPHTGRQHQLRVHMASQGHPMVCDDRYGLPEALIVTSPDGEEQSLRRFALHAAELTFEHPIAKKQMYVTAPLAQDFQSVLEGLRHGWTRRREPVPVPLPRGHQAAVRRKLAGTGPLEDKE